jgi:hypothetical protein
MTPYIRKPFESVAPLPRAKQISGYSGSIGGDHLQDIDNPTIDFHPYTIVRTQQPKQPVDIMFVRSIDCLLIIVS